MSDSAAHEPDGLPAGPRDDAPALQALLDASGHRAVIPAGDYRLSTPLHLRSGMRIEAEPGARFHADGISFLLETKGDIPCDEEIRISGGDWHGAGFRLSYLRDLHIEKVILSDAPRPLLLDHVDGFRLEDLTLRGGNGAIEIAGCCRHGLVDGLDATASRSEDATLSFLSDGPGTPSGPIELISLRRVAGARVRFASSGSTIRGLLLESVEKGKPIGITEDSFPADGHYDRIAIDGHDHSSPPQTRSGDRFPSAVLLEPGEFLVTSPYGRRVHPVTGERSSMHNGIDGALWDGRMLVETGICAWRGGVVISAEDDDGPAGTNVAIDHGNGLVSRYFHLERGSLRVVPGQRVDRCDLLGWMGRTGRSTGEHLHFQLERNGLPEDPTGALQGE